jgi:dethiobiotin synthetase
MHMETVLSAFQELTNRHDFTLVEGAGGLLVPILPGYTILDLCLDLQIPMLIVGHLGLGTINHVLLTEAVARARGIEIVGIVLNANEPPTESVAERTNPEIIASIAATPLVGVMPHLGPRCSERDDHDLASICRGAFDSKWIRDLSAQIPKRGVSQ